MTINRDGFQALTLEIYVHRARTTWWHRILDRVFPPIVYLGRRGSFVLIVNDHEMVRMRLARAAYDRPSRSLRAALPDPVRIRERDRFEIRVEFPRGVRVSRSVTFICHLDGYMRRGEHTAPLRIG